MVEEAIGLRGERSAIHRDEARVALGRRRRGGQISRINRVSFGNTVRGVVGFHSLKASVQALDSCGVANPTACLPA